MFFLIYLIIHISKFSDMVQKKCTICLKLFELDKASKEWCLPKAPNRNNTIDVLLIYGKPEKDLPAYFDLSCSYFCSEECHTVRIGFSNELDMDDDTFALDWEDDRRIDLKYHLKTV